jgi:hypothetical protein
MTSRKKQPSKLREKIEQLAEENEYYSMLEGKNRARSVTVGNTTGGLIEIVMRSDRATVHHIVRPVEAVEIIEQLAAAAGLEIAKRPKQDFTAWRSWDLDTPDDADWKGSAPWQLSDKSKRALKKQEIERFGILPAPTNAEKPKLRAASRRKKKVEEETEE